MEISSRSGIMILFATVAVCTLVLFPLLQYVAERDPQLSAYDDDWNDISNFGYMTAVQLLLIFQIF